MTITEADIENLKTDFYRFARLHSWYKHLRLEGTTFVFFKQTEQQVRYDFDKCLTNEPRTEFWHFVESSCTKYLKELSEKGVVMYQVQFGPFLRGLEHGEYFHGFQIIKGRNEGLVEYLQNKYKDFTNNNCSKEIINCIAMSEQREYLDNALQFNIYSPSNEL